MSIRNLFILLFCWLALPISAMDTLSPFKVSDSTTPTTKRLSVSDSATTISTTLVVTGAAQFNSTINATGNITGANLSGTNTGNVTLQAGATDAILGLSGQIISFDQQSSATFLAGPSLGIPAEPAFRGLVDTDIPDLSGTYQPLDATLTAWAAYNTNGLLTQTAADTFTGRTLTGDSEIVVSNGNGVSGNPTLSIAAAIARDAEVPNVTLQAGATQDILGLSTQELSFDQQTAATFLAGPELGIPAAPAFRGLTDTDIPADVARDAEVAAGYQPLDGDLTAIAALSGTGLGAHTAANTWAERTITGDTEITVANGNGVSGNPTLAIAAAIARDSELPVGANPSGTITGAVANGAAATFMRSDGVPAIGTTLTVADDFWVGLGAGAGRIEFDDQATDEVNILSANVGIGTATPAVLGDVRGVLQAKATMSYAANTSTTLLALGSNKSVANYNRATSYLFRAEEDTAAPYYGSLKLHLKAARFPDYTDDYGVTGGTLYDLVTFDGYNQRFGILANSPSATFSVGASSQFQIGSTGIVSAPQIGINDATPTEKLTVNGDVNIYGGALQVAATESVAAAYNRFGLDARTNLNDADDLGVDDAIEAGGAIYERTSFRVGGRKTQQINMASDATCDPASGNEVWLNPSVATRNVTDISDGAFDGETITFYNISTTQHVVIKRVNGQVEPPSSVDFTITAGVNPPYAANITFKWISAKSIWVCTGYAIL